MFFEANPLTIRNSPFITRINGELDTIPLPLNRITKIYFEMQKNISKVDNNYFVKVLNCCKIQDLRLAKEANDTLKKIAYFLPQSDASEENLAYATKKERILKKIHEDVLSHDLMKKIAISYKHDDEVFLSLLNKDGSLLRYASLSIKKNPNYVLAALKNFSGALDYAYFSFRSDKSFMLKAVKLSGEAFAMASIDLQSNRELVLAAVEKDGLALAFAASIWQEDFLIVLTAVLQNGLAIKHASLSLRRNKTIALAAIQSNIYAFHLLPDSLKSQERSIFCAAMSQHAFDIPNSRFFKNRRLMLKIVSQNGLVLRSLKAPLNDQFTIVMAAVKNNGLALKFASDRLKNEFVIVKEAVRNNGLALCFASDALKKSHEIVFSAIQNNGNAIEHADEAFIRMKEAVILAISKSPLAFYSVCPHFTDDREIILLAVRANGSLLSKASLELKDDEEVVFAAVQNQGYALEHASLRLRNCKKIVLEAVKQHSVLLHFASEKLKGDLEIIFVASLNFPKLSKLATDTLKQSDSYQTADFCFQYVKRAIKNIEIPDLHYDQKTKNHFKKFKKELFYPLFQKISEIYDRLIAAFEWISLNYGDKEGSKFHVKNYGISYMINKELINEMSQFYAIAFSNEKEVIELELSHPCDVLILEALAEPEKMRTFVKENIDEKEFLKTLFLRLDRFIDQLLTKEEKQVLNRLQRGNFKCVLTQEKINGQKLLGHFETLSKKHSLEENVLPQAKKRKT